MLYLFITSFLGRATAFNMEKGPSDGWFQRFTSRHPELSSRKPENLDKGRLSMSTAKVVGYYLEFLAGILDKYGIKNKPSQVMIYIATLCLKYKKCFKTHQPYSFIHQTTNSENFSFLTVNFAFADFQL